MLNGSRVGEAFPTSRVGRGLPGALKINRLGTETSPYHKTSDLKRVLTSGVLRLEVGRGVPVKTGYIGNTRAGTWVTLCALGLSDIDVSVLRGAGGV